MNTVSVARELAPAGRSSAKLPKKGSSRNPGGKQICRSCRRLRSFDFDFAIWRLLKIKIKRSSERGPSLQQLLQGNACTTNKIRQPAIASKPASAVIGALRNYVNNQKKGLLRSPAGASSLATGLSIDLYRGGRRRE